MGAGGERGEGGGLRGASGGVVTVASLRAVTVEAMSNLLSANIDAGLIHSIG